MTRTKSLSFLTAAAAGVLLAAAGDGKIWKIAGRGLFSLFVLTSLLALRFPPFVDYDWPTHAAGIRAGRAGRFPRMFVDIHGERPYCREGELADPGRTLPVPSIVDGGVNRIVVPAIEPLAIGEIGRAVIGGAGRIAPMAIVADALVLVDAFSAGDGFALARFRLRGFSRRFHGSLAGLCFHRRFPGFHRRTREDDPLHALAARPRLDLDTGVQQVGGLGGDEATLAAGEQLLDRKSVV